MTEPTVTVHPAVPVLAAHEVARWSRNGTLAHCTCGTTIDCTAAGDEYAAHLTDMLDQAGLLADGTPPGDPHRTSPRREGRQEDDVSEVPGIHDLAAWEAYYGEMPEWHRDGCACGDASPEGCGQLVFGYPYCRSCGDHHRMPECAVNEHGEALALCGHTWAEVDKPDHYDWCGQESEDADGPPETLTERVLAERADRRTT